MLDLIKENKRVWHFFRIHSIKQKYNLETLQKSFCIHHKKYKHGLATNYDLISKNNIEVLLFRNVEILPMKLPLSRKKAYLYSESIFKWSYQKSLSTIYYHYRLSIAS